MKTSMAQTAAIGALLLYCSLHIQYANAASTIAMESPVSTIVMPCPSQAEISQILKDARVNLETFPKGTDCHTSYLGKLASMLVFLKNLSLEDVASANPDKEILKYLAKPWDFFSGGYTTIRQFHSDSAFASLSLGPDKNLSLSDAFFSASPLLALSYLIHESNHGRKTDPGHYQCFQGQLEGTSGGCDLYLEKTIDRAGSYSVQFWFLWMLTKTNLELQRGDRAIVENFALTLLSQRFNFISDLGVATDVVVTLDKSGQVFVFDPLLQKGTRLKMPNDQSDPVEKIDYDQKSHGLIAYHASGKLSRWDSVTTEVSEFDDIISSPDVYPIERITRRFDFDIGVPRYLVISKNEKVWTELNSVEKPAERKFYSYQFPNVNEPIRQVISTSGPRTFVLTKSGRLLGFESFGPANLEIPSDAPQLTDIISNTLGRDLHAIDRQGRLQLVELKQKASIGMSSSTALEVSFKLDQLQGASGKAVKYQEGISLRGVLDSNGTLKLTEQMAPSRDGKSTPASALFSVGQIQDFVIVRRVSLHQHLQRMTGVETFQNICQVSNVKKEPWLGRLMGLRSNGDLILLNQRQCLVWKKNVRTFNVTGREAKQNRFGQVEPELMIDGQVFTGPDLTLNIALNDTSFVIHKHKVHLQRTDLVGKRTFPPLGTSMPN